MRAAQVSTHHPAANMGRPEVLFLQTTGKKRSRDDQQGKAKEATRRTPLDTSATLVAHRDLPSTHIAAYINLRGRHYPEHNLAQYTMNIPLQHPPADPDTIAEKLASLPPGTKVGWYSRQHAAMFDTIMRQTLTGEPIVTTEVSLASSGVSQQPNVIYMGPVRG
jgi:hypothetical protein